MLKWSCSVAGARLRTIDDQHRHQISLYVTLEPCLMCSAAISFVGIKRIVYAALAEDANAEQMIVRGLTKFNDQLVRGPFVLVPGVRRKRRTSFVGWEKRPAQRLTWKYSFFDLFKACDVRMGVGKQIESLAVGY